jgi:hypothetical protein
MVLESNGHGILVSQCSAHRSVAPPPTVIAPDSREKWCREKWLWS